MSSLFLVNADIISQLRKGEERDLRFEEVETMREKMSDGQTSDWHCGGKRIPYLRQEPLCGEISGLRFASLEMTGRFVVPLWRSCIGPPSGAK